MTQPDSSGADSGLYTPGLATERNLADLWARQRRALRRRAVPMALTFLVIAGLAFLVVLFWPPTYASTGTILIEQQEVPEDFVRSAITSYADQRVQMITQRVTSSANLLAIIARYNLYADARRATPSEAIVQRMRKDIKLDMISADVVDPRQGRATKATIAFAVTYRSRSPQLAVAVANELTSLYLRENLETRKEQAAGTTEFLSTESARIGKQVTGLEQKIADFKSKHENSLPEYAQLNLQLSNRAQDDLRDLAARIRALDQQIVFLDSQLAQINPNSQVYGDNGQRVLDSRDQLRVLQTQYTKALANYSESHPDVQRLKSEIDSLQKQIGTQTNYTELQRALAQARIDLAAARENHTESHPDVIKLSRQVANLEDRLSRAPRPSTPSSDPQKPDNPAYIQISANREAAQAERASLIEQQNQVRARIAQLDKESAAMPMVERDYNAMMADLQGAKSTYADIQQKLMEAQLASNLETARKGERFTLIEPPVEPGKPVSPNRLLILAGGFLLAIAAAVAAMQVLEALDTRIRGRDDVISLLTVAPLAVVPFVKFARR